MAAAYLAIAWHVAFGLHIGHVVQDGVDTGDLLAIPFVAVATLFVVLGVYASATADQPLLSTTTGRRMLAMVRRPVVNRTMRPPLPQPAQQVGPEVVPAPVVPLRPTAAAAARGSSASA